MNSPNTLPSLPSEKPTSETPTLRLQIKGVGHCPSFKNRKRSIIDSNTGRMRTLTPGDIKKRMQALEDAIVCELFSMCQTTGPETHSECWKRLRTVLSGLCDDSIKEIPCGEWDVKYVPSGEEGMEIVIERLP